MYYPDLAMECQIVRGPAVRAIGWLERGRPFATARAEPHLLDVLRRHATDAGRWQPLRMAGVHLCDIGPCPRTGGVGNLVIPGETCFYVAPELVLHYVEVHDYAPPAEFVAALLACPEQSSEDYVARILALPFAETWCCDAAAVRRLAAEAPRARAYAQEVRARAAANEGKFRW